MRLPFLQYIAFRLERWLRDDLMQQQYSAIILRTEACDSAELFNSMSGQQTKELLSWLAFSKLCRRLVVLAVTEGYAKSSESDERIPSWAQPDSDEPLPWAGDKGKETSQAAIEIPYFVYLLASAVTAIAVIGSIYEYVNQRLVFWILNSDSVFYAPLLGFFVFTGIPTSAFLWFKSVQAANKEAEEQDRRDSYR